MTRQELLGEAKGLRTPSAEAAAEYADKSRVLAEQVSAVLSARPDLLRLVGEGNQEMKLIHRLAALARAGTAHDQGVLSHRRPAGHLSGRHARDPGPVHVA